ncbi:hypothetical protein BA766_15455 [Stenotrophomonas maltophilia]|uniref:hypothetical protein n=1 Tax=Stenotrophomonas maltophilia TaxID=40324 RepID=UPI000810DB9A|nr:hypothetical protein [Stenotrophomonas maltophilia]OCK46137.1 hypothetical protein BA766_15455 [Stenotrophomonas maltophilia]
MYRLTKNQGEIENVQTGELIPEGHRLWDEYQQWVAEGNVPLPVPPPYQLHSPQHYQAIRSAAWDWMTAWVKERRYDSIETCVGYFNSGVPRYRDEARAMVAWRDAVNQELEALVLAAPTGIETWDQVRALLPQPEAFNWPGEVSLPLGTGESAVLA